MSDREVEHLLSSLPFFLRFSVAYKNKSFMMKYLQAEFLCKTLKYVIVRVCCVTFFLILR